MEDFLFVDVVIEESLCFDLLVFGFYCFIIKVINMRGIVIFENVKVLIYYVVVNWDVDIFEVFDEFWFDCFL